ncbi:MAG: ABC transporter ATP-binding protein [Desulfovibrio sp.]|jgi:ABC-type lipoprotein export system ATPase subunit|nr:ABC transporter ATP-binding protein [Desulfovibrio sp.]
MIRLENLCKSYQKASVLNGINWLIEDSSFVLITGRSGGGKTTLLSIVGGLTRPDEGRVLIDDIDIWRLPEPELAALRNRKIGFVFQFPSLIPALRVLDNVLLPIAFSGRSPNRADREFAGSLLALVGITDKENAYPSQLSGGQQRRVAIARALINRPSILLADEPTGDLDERTEAEIMNLFQDINRQGVMIVMVTHALDYAALGTTYLLKTNQLFPHKAELSPPGAGREESRHGE